MFDLFGKKGGRSPQERVDACQKKGDWAGLARAYYDMGVAAMEQEDLNSAALWLHRADTVYSARDEVYEAVGEALTDDCSERIGTLEEAVMLHNNIPFEVEQKAEELGDIQVRIWGLFSFARLVSLGERLGRLPGCGVLGTLGWAVDTMLKSFREPISQEEISRLLDTCSQLYELSDSENYYAGGEIAVDGGAPFQVFDLNSMLGVLLELDEYLDNHVNFLGAISQGEAPPEAQHSIVSCTLLPDYYVRTGAGPLEKVPQIEAELSRIWGDYHLLCAGLTWEQVAEKVEAYKALDILKVQ